MHVPTVLLVDAQGRVTRRIEATDGDLAGALSR
jgi:hypothetical protein